MITPFGHNSKLTEQLKQERIRKAAPQLLEALEELLHRTFPDGVDNDGSGRTGFNKDCIDRYNKARAAIAAAKGE